MLTLKVPPEKMKAVLIAGSSLIGILVCVWLAGPAIGRWRSLDEEIARKEAVLAKNLEWLSKYEAAGGESARQSMPATGAQTVEEGLARVLSAIESISQQSAFRLLNLKPRTPKSFGSYKEISFDITGEGTAEAFSRFLYGLETSPEVLAVKNFSLAPASRQSGKLKASVLVAHFL